MKRRITALSIALLLIMLTLCSCGKTENKEIIEEDKNDVTQIEVETLEEVTDEAFTEEIIPQSEAQPQQEETAGQTENTSTSARSTSAAKNNTTTTKKTTLKQSTTNRPTTTVKPTTTKKPTTTLKPTTTKKPTTTVKPTTTKKPTTTVKPTTTKPTTTKVNDAITVSKTSVSLEKGQSVVVNVTILGQGTVTCSKSNDNDDFITISWGDGKGNIVPLTIHANGAGKTQLKIYYKNNPSRIMATIDVTVTAKTYTINECTLTALNSFPVTVNESVGGPINQYEIYNFQYKFREQTNDSKYVELAVTPSLIKKAGRSEGNIKAELYDEYKNYYKSFNIFVWSDGLVSSSLNSTLVEPGKYYIKFVDNYR